MGQRVRAPHHGFSQLATSFLACPRLGILRAPLLRLVSVQRTCPKADPSNAPPNLIAAVCITQQFLTHTHFTFTFDQLRLGVFADLALDNRHATQPAHVLTQPIAQLRASIALSRSRPLLQQQKARYPNPYFQSSIRVALGAAAACPRSYYFVRPEPLKITKSASRSTPF